MNKYFVMAAAVLLLAVVVWQLTDRSEQVNSDKNLSVWTEVSSDRQAVTDKNITNNKMDTFKQAEQVIVAGKSYQAVLKTTVGDITIDLFADTTPITVNNFVFLAKKNFYDNTIFHRVIKGFMIQGGDPKGDGTGGPGYRFQDEPFSGEYQRGIVAMANAGPDTNGSQFFIMQANRPLPKNYVIFGKVSAGIDVVDTIATAAVELSPAGEMSRPVKPVVVQSVEIIEN